ncbi:MAG: alpha/beta hydrolase family protein [Gammaproteobacteria bacterium]|nr:alpha/beta hydrolase family protein [Gammaproteobacteria bacterium]MBU2478554.1 alpha/beta hydrolase family protein [Gammaproteobacteria bacterium]
MFRLKLLSLLVFFLAIANTTLALASDTDKEKRWADQTVDSLLVGEAEWLEAEGQKFLGIYTEELSGTPKGGVIILHGIGVHPNWEDVIYPLRTELPNYGWATLSIQMPILANEAELKDYIPLIKEAAPRIKAAQAFLKSKDVTPVVLIAHSLGATMASATLAETGDMGFIGFAAIGMSSSDLDPQLDTTAQIAKLKLPILDLYGSRDLDTVLASATPRAAAARKVDNDKYRQLEIEGADHFFVGLEDELVTRVRGWLEQLTK